MVRLRWVLKESLHLSLQVFNARRMKSSMSVARLVKRTAHIHRHSALISVSRAVFASPALCGKVIIRVHVFDVPSVLAEWTSFSTIVAALAQIRAPWDLNHAPDSAFPTAFANLVLSWQATDRVVRAFRCPNAIALSVVIRTLNTPNVDRHVHAHVTTNSIPPRSHGPVQSSVDPDASARKVSFLGETASVSNLKSAALLSRDSIAPAVRLVSNRVRTSTVPPVHFRVSRAASARRTSSVERMRRVALAFWSRCVKGVCSSE